MATLAAPPGRSLRCAARTIGTGASGEIRSTSPQIYLSSITSPTTRACTCCQSRSTSRITSCMLSIIELGLQGLLRMAEIGFNPIAENVAHQDVGLLNARGIGRGDAQAAVREFGGAAAPGSGHGHRVDTQLPPLLN